MRTRPGTGWTLGHIWARSPGLELWYGMGIGGGLFTTRSREGFRQALAAIGLLRSIGRLHVRCHSFYYKQAERFWFCADCGRRWPGLAMSPRMAQTVGIY